MAFPDYDHVYEYEGTANELTFDLPVNGSSEWAVGDLVFIAVCLDGQHASSLTNDETGWTEHDVQENSIGNAITFGLWSKVLVSGDLSLTGITFSWTGSDKACAKGYRYAAANHNGIVTPVFDENADATAAELPAIDFGSDSCQSFGFSATDANAGVSANPTAYTTDDDLNSAGSGNNSLWIGTSDTELTGSQSVNSMTISAGRGNIQAILGVIEPASAGAEGSVTLGVGNGMTTLGVAQKSSSSSLGVGSGMTLDDVAALVEDVNLGMGLGLTESGVSSVTAALALGVGSNIGLSVEQMFFGAVAIGVGNGTLISTDANASLYFGY